jgi:hypothetical protein
MSLALNTLGLFPLPFANFGSLAPALKTNGFGVSLVADDDGGQSLTMPE